MDKSKNPNHKEESKTPIVPMSECIKVNNSDLEFQDVNENFLELKNSLIYFQDKSKVEEIQKTLDEVELKYLKIDEEVSKNDVLEQGLDLVFLADVSESMHPWRIYQKKSMYLVLKDLEYFLYSIPDVSAESFSKVRIAFVTYSDRDAGVQTTEFVDYKSIGDICKKIDEIKITNHSEKKRAALDGLKSLTDLGWKEDAVKIVVHHMSEPPYGKKYTTNIKSCSEDYDPIPEDEEFDAEEIFSSVNDLGAIYNLIKFGDKLEKFQKEFSSTVQFDACKPKVDKI